MITDETIREYEAQLEAEWAELDEQFYDALERGYLPDVELAQERQTHVIAKMRAVQELQKMETEKLKNQVK